MNRTLRLKVLRASGMLAVTLFAVALVSEGGFSLTGADPSIQSFTIDSGGGTSTGGSFELSGTIGQLDGGGAPGLSGGAFAIVGGFWPASITTAPECFADITGNSTVDVDDLLAVINAWGTCPTPPELCPADISPPGFGNGVVDIDDLLIIINAWGPCSR
jgi:hypothetical protein